METTNQKQINSGGPAFPLYEQTEYNTGNCVEEGMSLRDYFAAKVLPTLALSAISGERWKTTKMDEDKINGHEKIYVFAVMDDELEPYTEIANVAYRIADAMLKSRKEASHE